MFREYARTTYDALTVDGAKQSTAIDASAARVVTYVVVASSASTPSGTDIQVQGSLDNSNWFDLGSSDTVSGNGVFSVSIVDAAYKFYRLSYTHSSGSYVATTSVIAKG